MGGLPQQVAVLIFKVIFSLLGLSILVSLISFFPYYMNLTNMGAEITLRASLNSYITQAEIDEIVDRYLGTGSPVMNSLTFYNSSGLEDITEDNVERTEAIRQAILDSVKITVKGEDQSSGEMRNIIINRNRNVFDPANEPTDLVDLHSLIGQVNRNSKIEVRIETKYRAILMLPGKYLEVAIPTWYDRDSIALRYYRYREVN